MFTNLQLKATLAVDLPLLMASFIWPLQQYRILILIASGLVAKLYRIHVEEDMLTAAFQ